MFGPAFARRHARHYFRAVIHHLLRVKSAFAPSKPLHDQTSALINQHAHRAPPARATAFSAPSFIPSATAKFRPECFKISFPCWTFVPSMRTTTGTLNFNSFAAFTTPLASTSQRKMPPKIFTNTALHVGIAQQNAKCIFHLFFRSAAAYIQKVRRTSATQLDDVHRSHREARAVHHAGDSRHPA